MKLITKTLLAGLVALDVASINACGQIVPPKKDNEYLFFGKNNEVLYRTKFTKTLKEPKLDFGEGYEQYEFKYWYMFVPGQDQNGDEAVKTKVEFPYTYNEDDVISYYFGHRSVIIFKGEFEDLTK